MSEELTEARADGLAALASFERAVAAAEDTYLHRVLQIVEQHELAILTESRRRYGKLLSHAQEGNLDSVVWEVFDDFVGASCMRDRALHSDGALQVTIAPVLTRVVHAISVEMEACRE